uniref:AAA-ATPase At3g50940-like n=1 Tax=Tanacetum cinerariifolium TaxID=118510 RepID=A0A6L2NGV1_TANCI|nr:AAA-ATPase At3g50940-like [Tanacetum cinerariifolium]
MPPKGKNHHSSQTEIRFLELTFHQEHKDLVLNDYLPSILKQAELKKREEEIVKIFTVNPHTAYKNKPWLPVDLGHPSTFATLAMDTDIKEKVMKDVERFVARRDYYRKVGNPWKRGYLLYGPPGSGKSSLIAAMANYLNFDIYDLDLSTIKFNATLSSSTKSKIRTIKTIVSTIGAVTTTVMVVRSVAKDYLPPEFRDYIYLGLKSFINKFSTHLAIVIYESDDFKPNEIYKAAEQYISTKMSLEANRLKVTKTPNQEHHIQVSADEKLEFTDTYNEVKLYWSSRSKKNMISTKNNEKGKNHHSSQTEIRFLELTFHQEHKDLVLNDYLPSILKQAELKKREEEIVKIFTVTSLSGFLNFIDGLCGVASGTSVPSTHKPRATCENVIGGIRMRLGDKVTASNGKTIETKQIVPIILANW